MTSPIDLFSDEAHDKISAAFWAAFDAEHDTEPETLEEAA